MNVKCKYLIVAQRHMILLGYGSHPTNDQPPYKWGFKPKVVYKI